MNPLLNDKHFLFARHVPNVKCDDKNGERERQKIIKISRVDFYFIKQTLKKHKNMITNFMPN